MDQNYIASDKETNGEGDKRNEQREIQMRCATSNAHFVRKLAQ